MRLILSTLAVIALCVSCAPTKKIEKLVYPSPFEFESVDTVSATKNELFVRAHEWIAKTFGSAKAVIDMQDKEAGKLIGKGKETIGSGVQMLVDPTITYLFTIDVKDGKYRMRISDVVHTAGTSYPSRSGFTAASKTRSYGNLSNEYVPITNPNTGAKSTGREYYAVKNHAMLYCQNLIKDFNKAMHTPSKDF